MLFASAVCYNAAFTAAKLSILAFYMRISPERKHKIAVWTMAVITLAVFIAGVCCVLFQCRPVYAAWDFTTKDAKCISIVNYYYAAAGINIVTDVAILLIPVPVLWQTSLPARQKFSVLGIFSVGAFVCVASVIRLVNLHVLRYPVDLTYVILPALNWTVIETHVAIFCASIPALKPLILRHSPRFFDAFSDLNQSKYENFGRTGASNSYVIQGGARSKNVATGTTSSRNKVDRVLGTRNVITSKTGLKEEYELEPKGGVFASSEYTDLEGQRFKTPG